MIASPPSSWIDLTHTLTPHVPSWGGGCGFQQEIKRDYHDEAGQIGFRVQQIKMHAGLGTHMDAPSHCIPGGRSIDEIPLEELCCPCVVINVTQKAHESYSVSVQDIQTFEQNYGPIPPHALVIVYTGWDQYWNAPLRYRNAWRFPSVSSEAAEALLERNIRGLGIDTLSPDRPEGDFPVHRLILGANKYIIENVACAQKLPPLGAQALALPLKTQEGTEAPVRLVAWVA